MTELDSRIARGNMIGQQIRAWEVLNERILNVLETVARDQFVPTAFTNLAYSDTQIPLGHGQVMLEPKIQGRLLQSVDPAQGDRALEIGTGTGFLTACLSHLCEHVTSVEILPNLHAAAEENLAKHGSTNCKLELGDASIGWLEDNEYDVIVTTSSIPTLDQRFQQQLALGGRLFVIVGQPPIMEALLITRVGEDQWSTKSLFDCYAPPLIGVAASTPFIL